MKVPSNIQRALIILASYTAIVILLDIIFPEPAALQPEMRSVVLMTIGAVLVQLMLSAAQHSKKKLG
ncbi:MAG TPA: hypothetical protein VGE31_00935 [Candidatus Paceibacterota bacterium]